MRHGSISRVHVSLLGSLTREGGVSQINLSNFRPETVVCDSTVEQGDGRWHDGNRLCLRPEPYHQKMIVSCNLLEEMAPFSKLKYRYDRFRVCQRHFSYAIYMRRCSRAQILGIKFVGPIDFR